MNKVQLRDAKAKLSALLDAAERGEATTITRHGKPAAVLVSVEDWARLEPKTRSSLIDHLMAMPASIPLRRNRSKPRRFEF